MEVLVDWEVLAWVIGSTYNEVFEKAVPWMDGANGNRCFLQ